MIARGTIVRIAALFIILCASTHYAYIAANQNSSKPAARSSSKKSTPTQNFMTPQGHIEKPRIVNEIIVSGNKYVSSAAIISHVPYQPGENFDPNKTRALIKNIYQDLKRFSNIEVFGEDVGDDRINIHIIVTEKTPIKEIIYKGNKNLTLKEINEKTTIADTPSADEQELKKLALQIKKLYLDKGYNEAIIDAALVLDNDKKADLVFTIQENKKAIVKQIRFVGNTAISSKKLRSVIFTREDWIGSFLDKAGTYQPERLDADRHMIEQCYQNSGYLQAKVTKTDLDIHPHTKHTIVTHHIKEGEKYTIKEVKVSCDNDLLPEAYLLSRLPIHAGDLYSREAIVNAIKGLEFLWGDLGYLNASVEPSVQPDEENHAISLTFYIDPGLPVTLNKLIIRGNKKTRDKVIRRKIGLREGELITNSGMEWSKTRIQSLGYFDQRDGVTWKTTRLAEDLADLEMIIKEAKTGSLSLKFGLGGAGLQSPSGSASLEAGLSDTNLFGKGIQLNANGRLSANEKTAVFTLTQPWLFDRPIYSSIDIYHKRLNYDQLRLTPPVVERYTGGALTLGFVSGLQHYLLNDTFFRFRGGLDHVDYGFEKIEGVVQQCVPKASIPTLCNDPSGVERGLATTIYNGILAQLFEPSTYPSLGLQIGQDKKNHPVHTNSGYAWLLQSNTAFATTSGTIGFNKFDADFNWFTPLINDYDLVFRFHTYLGFVHTFKGKTTPYRELFHIGGPATVRGFLFGQIGPQFAVTNINGDYIQDSIGGSKAFVINAELIFPITSDFTMKGLLFYDGGAGWQNPYVCAESEPFIRNNQLNYRHAIGVGIRLLQPAPISVDWGFKLDAHKGEPASEVHFGMTYGW